MHMILLLKFFDLCQNRLYFSFHRVTIVYMVKKGHYNKPGFFIRMSISAGLFPANTLIRSSGLHSLAFGFGTFASQKTKLPRLATVCSRKARHRCSTRCIRNK